MHTFTILSVISLAILVRQLQPKSTQNYQKYASQVLFCFLFPPLLLLTTTAAFLYMGPGGEMLGQKTSQISYLLAIAFLLPALGLIVQRFYQQWLLQRQLKNYPQQSLQGYPFRLLDLDFPFAGCCGFWSSELILSRGLLETLSENHLQAVLAHEQAHQECGDTFYFFWLGWLRSLTFWLPHTELLWEELLFLREIRADRRAAQQVDPLLIAESLLIILRTNLTIPRDLQIPFSCNFASHRLTERIESLLSLSETNYYPLSWLFWGRYLSVLLPWFTVPFHS